MSEQLQLVAIPAAAKLTPRQQRALEHVQAAGHDGIHADELGAILHEQDGKHGRDDRCAFDGANGNGILRALRAKGLVRYRRGTPAKPGYWQAAGHEKQPISVPYNEFPEGY